MSIQHANRGIVKKDLQLYYNREFQKSFRGEATSNLIMNPSDANYYQGLYNFTVTPNAAVAPDGSNNAWILAWNGTAFNYYSKNFPIVNSTVYTTSVFAKAGTHDVIWIGVSSMSGGENNASFNLTTGVATNGSPASTSCSMVYYGGGWWRCIMTNTSGTSGATTSAMTVSIGSGRASLGTVYFWGFQAERKAYVSTFLDSLNPIRNQVATNLYSADPYDGLDFVTVYNYQGSTGASFYAVVGIDNPINAPNVLQYNTGTSGYQYFALTKTGLASGTYTVSYYARLASGGPSALNNAQLWRDNVSDRLPDGDWNPTIYTYWRRFRATALVTSGTLHFFPIHNNPITGGFTVYFTGFQLESGNEPTSFTPSSVSTANTISSNGGLLDISGNNINADLTTVGFDSSGFKFDGSSQFINLGTLRTSLNISADLTIEAVIKLTSNFTLNPTIVGNGYWQEIYPYKLQFEYNSNNGNLGLFRYDGTNYRYASWNFGNQNTFFLNKYAYVTATYNSMTNSFAIYYNGISQSITQSNPGTISVNNTTNFAIGVQIKTDGTKGDYFPGEINIVRVYNRALSAAEVLQNFTATRKTYGV